jgi:hypothetical protein
MDCKKYSTCYLDKVDTVLIKYIKKIIKGMYPYNLGHARNLFCLIRIIQLLISFFILVGCLLPKKFRDIHIISSLITLFLWYLLKNKSIISILIKYLFKLEYYPEFVPISSKTKDISVFLVLGISLIGLFDEKYSGFNIIKSGIENLNKYN